MYENNVCQGSFAGAAFRIPCDKTIVPRVTIVTEWLCDRHKAASSSSGTD